MTQEQIEEVRMALGRIATSCYTLAERLASASSGKMASVELTSSQIATLKQNCKSLAQEIQQEIIAIKSKLAGW